MEKLFCEEMVDDIFLLKRIGENDKEAFKCLFDTYFVPLCRFVRTFVNDCSVAEDIVMDIFTTVWEKRNELEIDVSWKAYLFRSARNRALNYIRDNERFVSVSDWSFYDITETDHPYELAELERLIREAVSSLPDHCREVFRKSRFEHHTNKEIATTLNISVKYVEAQITKALKLIRKYLGDSYTCP